MCRHAAHSRAWTKPCFFKQDHFPKPYLRRHVDTQHAVGLGVETSQRALSDRSLPRAHWSYKQDGLLAVDERGHEELVAHHVHRGHNLPEERQSATQQGQELQHCAMLVRNRPLKYYERIGKGRGCST